MAAFLTAPSDDVRLIPMFNLLSDRADYRRETDMHETDEAVKQKTLESLSRNQGDA